MLFVNLNKWIEVYEIRFLFDLIVKHFANHNFNAY